jgi:hypothetical protein
MPRLKTPYGYMSAGRGFGAGVSEGISNIGDVFLKQALNKIAAQEADQRLTDRELKLRQDEHVNQAKEEIRKGSATIEDYPDLIPFLKNNVSAGPSQAERTAKAVEKIGPYSTNQDIQALLDANKADTTPQFGQTAMLPGNDAEATLPSTQFGPVAAKPWEDATRQRFQAKQMQDAKMGDLAKAEGVKSYEESYGRNQAENDVDAANFDDKLNRTGQTAFTTAFNSQRGANDPVINNLRAQGAGQETGARFDAEHTPARMAREVGLKSTLAGAEAGARFPWEQKLTQTRFDQRPLPGNLSDEVANMNMAEQEGVRILRAIDKLGMGDINNPLDPRWQQFVQQNVKMAPDDPDLQAIMQGTAATRAGVLRGFLGGRGGAQLAQEYGQHLPATAMTPKLLKETLNAVLRQNAEKRSGLAAGQGLRDDDPRIAVPMGSRFNDYLQDTPDSGPKTPDITAAEKLMQLRRGGK